MASEKIVISAIDETRAAFQSVQSNINRLTGGLRGVAGPLAAAFSVAAITAFSKSLIDTADRLSDLSTQTGIAGSELSRFGNAAQLNGSSAEEFNNAIVKFSKSISEAASGSKNQKDAFEALGISIKDANGNIRPTLDLFNELADRFSRTEDGANKVKVAQDLLGRSGSELIPFLNQGSAALAKYQSTFSDEFIQKAAQFNDNLDKLIIRLKGLAATILGPIVNALNKFFSFFEDGPSEGGIRIAIETTGELTKEVIRFKEEAADFVTFGEAMKETIKDFDYKNLKKSTDEVVEGIRMASITIDDFGMNAVMNLEDSILSLAMGTTTLKDAFKSMAASIISDLMRMYIRYSITKPLFDAIFGTTSTTPAPIFDAGMSPSTAPGRAIGGSVQRGQTYMVGERGPEMFIPNASGSIVPNDQMGNGGGTTIVNLNISTGVAQTVRAEIQNMMPRITEATKAAVADAKRRGGTYGKMMA